MPNSKQNKFWTLKLKTAGSPFLTPLFCFDRGLLTINQARHHLLDNIAGQGKANPGIVPTPTDYPGDIDIKNILVSV
jgi:hypothetical protein